MFFVFFRLLGTLVSTSLPVSLLCSHLLLAYLLFTSPLDGIECKPTTGMQVGFGHCWSWDVDSDRPDGEVFFIGVFHYPAPTLSSRLVLACPSLTTVVDADKLQTQFCRSAVGVVGRGYRSAGWSGTSDCCVLSVRPTAVLMLHPCLHSCLLRSALGAYCWP